MGNTVKGADPERCTRHAKQRFDAGAHLPRGFVGEGHRHDAVWRSAFGLNQPRYTMREHTCLTTTGACQHQHRTDRCRDGFALSVVERIEYRREIHAGREF
mgnify:CR=1 FL=1